MQTCDILNKNNTVVKSVYFVMERTTCNIVVFNIYVAIGDIKQHTLTLLLYMYAAESVSDTHYSITQFVSAHLELISVKHLMASVSQLSVTASISERNWSHCSRFAPNSPGTNTYLVLDKIHSTIQSRQCLPHIRWCWCCSQERYQCFRQTCHF